MRTFIQCAANENTGRIRNATRIDSNTALAKTGDYSGAGAAACPGCRIARPTEMKRRARFGSTAILSFYHASIDAHGEKKPPGLAAGGLLRAAPDGAAAAMN